MKKKTRSADFCADQIDVTTNFCCYNECRYKEGPLYLSLSGVFCREKSQATDSKFIKSTAAIFDFIATCRIT